MVVWPTVERGRYGLAVFGNHSSHNGISPFVVVFDCGNEGIETHLLMGVIPLKKY